MLEQLTLHGCSPTPLASYLKALGVLRLLSSRTSSVTDEPADPLARGWWEGERFHLRTALERDGLLDFFLHHYVPSPIIAPWNGGSGFYPKDEKSEKKKNEKNEKKKNEKNVVQLLRSEAVAKRFRPLSRAIQSASNTLNLCGLAARPQGRAKAQLVAMLRAQLPASALPWLDAAVVLSGEGLRFPKLLGTGGNDGHLDFTNNLMRRLFSEAKPPGIFNASSGEPSPVSTSLLKSALFRTPVHELMDVAVGQFSPGKAGGPNATTGYEGKPTVNPWDYVLMLEGASTFACAATRRYQSNASARASFPFTVAASGAGWGGIEAGDESEARAEFWAPLWTRPARFCEIEALFGEGRAVTNGRTARDGLEFARALATLGVSRGFSEFQRFGFFKRAGKSHYAAAIGRRQADPSPGAELLADLDKGNWLNQARRFGRDGKQSASIRNAVKGLEDSIFELLAPECPRRSVSTALRAIGRLGRWLSISQKEVDPPPLLSRSWLLRADDRSPEFRIASALAGLAIPSPTWRRNSDSADIESGILHAPPMAAHLAPLTNGANEGFEAKTFFRGDYLRKRRGWATGDHPPTVVWSHGELVANMIAVLERRLVETSIRGLTDKPFDSAISARLPDVVAFLTEDFDDARCSALLAGMVWAQPACLPANATGSTLLRTAVPFAYAALKPIFSTNEALHRVGAIPKEGSIPIPSGLVGQLRAGDRSQDGRASDQAVRTAFSRARSSGLVSPYDSIQSGEGASALHCGRIGVGIRSDRLVASMLIPISDQGLRSLLRRAYPDAIIETITQS